MKLYITNIQTCINIAGNSKVLRYKRRIAMDDFGNILARYRTRKIKLDYFYFHVKKQRLYKMLVV